MRAGGPTGLAFSIVLAVVVSSAAAPAEPLLTAVEQVRSLPAQQASGGHPVRITGVVTARSGWKNSFFVQDATAGISVDRLDTEPEVQAGDQVEISGKTAPGLFAPIIVAEHVRVLGREAPPAPLRARFADLLGGKQDSQWIEVTGVVHSASISESWGRQVLFLNVDMGDGTISVRVLDFPKGDPSGLVDAEVVVRGVCGTNFNVRRQFVGVRLFVNSLADVRIVTAAPADPFTVPAQPLDGIFGFTGGDAPRHRLRVEGVVTHQERGGLFLQSGGQGIYVQTDQDTPAPAGTLVTAVGFAAMGEYSPRLQAARYRILGQREPPAPVPVKAEEIIAQKPDGFMSAPYDGLLVRIRGHLIDRVSGQHEQILALRSGGTLFSAHMDGGPTPAPGGAALNGSVLELTGICIVRTDQNREPRSFEIKLRGPADLVTVTSPPWWNLRRAAQVLVFAILCAVLAFLWIVVLQRQVRRQTADLKVAETRLRESLAKEQEAARSDFLTGLSNRREFTDAGERELRRSQRYGRTITLAYIDLDNFKAVNDTLGHETGDELLVTVAATIRDTVRATDLVARIGGDEFAVLLPETGGEGAQSLMEKLHRLLLEAMERKRWPVTFSIGAVICETAPASFEALLREADHLMYSAKREGKNRVVTAVRPSAA